MIIRVKDLRLRPIVGVNEWERKVRQDVVINLAIEPRTESSAESDELSETSDYKAIAKRIIESVEKTEFQLLERLAGHILDLVFEDPTVGRAAVEIDKPHALRFADSVSVELERSRE